MQRLLTLTLMVGATLTTCLGQPTLDKTFGAISIGPGTSTAVTFTLGNPSVSALTGVGFTDSLPAGLVVSSPNGLTTSCAGGTIVATAGSSSIGLTGVSLAPGASCTFSVNVTADGTVLNLLTNPAISVGSNEQAAGTSAPASIFVGDPFQLSYFPNLSLGDSVINIVNTGANGAGLAGGTSAAVIGAICINAYTFAPDEQMVTCCSCTVTPNALVSLSVKGDLLGDPLTPGVPTSVVVKLVATVPVSGTCNNSAAVVSLAGLAPGLAAWGTKLHDFAGVTGGTETPFGGAILSAGELARLSSLCTFINANGSGFGICRTCRLGGSGALGR